MFTSGIAFLVLFTQVFHTCHGEVVANLYCTYNIAIYTILTVVTPDEVEAASQSSSGDSEM